MPFYQAISFRYLATYFCIILKLIFKISISTSEFEEVFVGLVEVDGRLVGRSACLAFT